MTPKQFLQEKGISPEEPIYWYGENEFLTLENLMQEYMDKQLRLHGVSKFDMQKFKDYVNTYDKRKNGLDNDETIVKDMIYGIGLCLDKEEYCFAGGYKKFKAFLKAFL